MKKSQLTPMLVAAVALGVTSCQSARVERKAEEYRRSGAARDMVEARQMAENYYWPASARTQDDDRRTKSEVFPRREDARR